VSVSDAGQTDDRPTPGLYRCSTVEYDIRISQRGHWYAMRVEPDGTSTYVAQDIDLDEIRLEGSERQPSGCTEPECAAPVWHRGLCGMHLAADAVLRARAA
jgi:hypothetical protein